jgi:hypothetical protein
VSASVGGQGRKVPLVAARDADPLAFQGRAALKQVHRLRQGDALRFHDASDHAARRIAAEAVVQVLALGDRQTRRGFLVEHAAHHPILAALHQFMPLAFDQAQQRHVVLIRSSSLSGYGAYTGLR